jgi:hypothetical protein
VHILGISARARAERERERERERWRGGGGGRERKGGKYARAGEARKAQRMLGKGLGVLSVAELSSVSFFRSTKSPVFLECRIDGCLRGESRSAGRR